MKSKKVTFGYNNNNHHHDNQNHDNQNHDINVDISNLNFNSKNLIQQNDQEVDCKVNDSRNNNLSTLHNASCEINSMIIETASKKTILPKSSSSESKTSSESSLSSSSSSLDHSSSYSSRSDTSNNNNNNNNLMNINDENHIHAINPSFTLNPHNSSHHHNNNNDHINSSNINNINSSSSCQQHHHSSINQLSIHDDSSRNIELNGKRYTRLNILGKGGSSCVYRIISNDDGQVYAYKRIEVKDSDDIDTVFDNYANEILLLKKLRFNNDDSTDNNNNNNNNNSNNADEVRNGISKHKTSSSLSSYSSSSSSSSILNVNRIIELIDYEICRSQHYIAMILEAGDIDLAKVLDQKSPSLSSASVVNNQYHKSTNRSSNSSNSGGSSSSSSSKDDKFQSLLDPFFARMVWRQMLEAVDHIHKHRIVHGKL